MKHKKTEQNSPTSSKKSKHKKKKSKEKKKKHEKTRKCSSSSSSNSTDDEQVWVEKVPQSSASIENDSDGSKEEEPLKREDWMSLNSLFPCISNPSNEEKKKSQRNKGDVDRSILDKPGQSTKELNPYWKNGGTGLPQEDPEKLETGSVMDVNWLRKSLQRAKEQALSEGKSLHEIAAERWGSLEKIESMIAKAESAMMWGKSGRPNVRYDKNKSDFRSTWDHNKRQKPDSQSRNRDRYDSSNQHQRRNVDSRSNRSRSRSSSRERYSRYNRREMSPQDDRRKKQTYKKPSDDDYYGHTSHRMERSQKRNWRKDKEKDQDASTEQGQSTSSERISKETVAEVEFDNLQIDNNADAETKSNDAKPLTEAELNKLGARIVKAEIMGDNELAAELKLQLENARKLSKKPAGESKEVENVILTRTDAKGVARPLEPRTQSRETGNPKKRKNAQTHVSGERVRHFFDDDKYSLDQLFQREKGRSVNEDDATFTKVMSKNMDMNDIFEEQIMRVRSDAKQDEKDRAQAIKEHKRMSKSLDNCRWCVDSKHMLKHMIVSMDSRMCLSLPSHASLTEGHCVLTPVQHTACQLQLDEDVWKQLKVFKRALCKMFKDQDEYPVFFEVYKSRHKFPHMQLECVPLPKEVGESAPMYFKKALLECETEWSVNKKVIDLKDRDIRQTVPHGLSYFMVQFGMDRGYAHVIEDEHMFPKNFAEEIIGGMLDLDHDLWRKPRKEGFEQQREKVLKFSSMWKKYDDEVKTDAD